MWKRNGGAGLKLGFGVKKVENGTQETWGGPRKAFIPPVVPGAATCAKPSGAGAGLTVRARSVGGESKEWAFITEWWCCRKQGLGTGKWEGGSPPPWRV